MKRQKLKITVSVILSIAIPLSVVLLFYFMLFYPIASNTYKEILNYPEALYEDYEREAERIIAEHEYSCKYPIQATIDFEGDQLTLVLKVGNFKDTRQFADYITVTVKNFETNEQEITFERNVKNVEETSKSAKQRRIVLSIVTVIYILLLIGVIVYSITNSIKGHYFKAFFAVLIFVMFFTMTAIPIARLVEPNLP